MLLGTSLGGAVAIQAAAIDPRISAVVAAEVFSDLRTIAGERRRRSAYRRLIDGAAHNQSLREEKIWGEVDAWIENALLQP
jgi:cephalosporin-C deacetylase-like acetyl esterase